MISDRPSMVLGFAGEQAMGQIRSVFGAHGLKQGSGRALTVLAERGPLSQQALLEALACDPSVLVSILNDLEGMGLADRRRDSADRRRHIVALLPEGTQVASRIAEDLAAAEEELFAALAPAEVTTLVNLLAKLAAGVDCDAPDACGTKS